MSVLEWLAEAASMKELPEPANLPMVGPGEEVVGELTDYLKALWLVHSRLQMEAEENTPHACYCLVALEIGLKTVNPHEAETIVESMEGILRLKKERRIIEAIFSSELRGRYGRPGFTLSLRQGWQVVRVPRRTSAVQAG